MPRRKLEVPELAEPAENPMMYLLQLINDLQSKVDELESVVGQLLDHRHSRTADGRQLVKLRGRRPE